MIDGDLHFSCLIAAETCHSKSLKKIELFLPRYRQIATSTVTVFLKQQIKLLDYN